jgi:hypothetical protein
MRFTSPNAYAGGYRLHEPTHRRPVHVNSAGDHRSQPRLHPQMKLPIATSESKTRTNVGERLIRPGVSPGDPLRYIDHSSVQ